MMNVTAFTHRLLVGDLVGERLHLWTRSWVTTTFNDWLPSLERAASWNSWGDGEKLLQLACHLRGQALKEWNLIPLENKSTYTNAVQVLRSRVDPEAGQDFRALSLWPSTSDVWRDFFKLLVAVTV